MTDMRINDFIEWLEENEKSENTINTYKDSVKLYYSMFNETTKRNMISFKKYVSENFKPKTASNRCIAMNQYCEFLGKQECKVKTLKIPKQTSVENVISEEEYRKLLEGLKEDGNEKIYWIIQFLAKTGARCSEFLQFKKEHLKTGEVVLFTKGKIRKILIPKNLIEESKAYFASQPDSVWMFPNRHGEKMSSRGLAEIIKNNGIKYGIRKEVLHPHSFRHFYAIKFLENDGNISLLSDLLGHESLDTTSIYLRLSHEEQIRRFDAAMKW